jgi:hypothetical protein
MPSTRPLHTHTHTHTHLYVCIHTYIHTRAARMHIHACRRQGHQQQLGHVQSWGGGHIRWGRRHGGRRQRRRRRRLFDHGLGQETWAPLRAVICACSVYVSWCVYTWHTRTESSNKHQRHAFTNSAMPRASCSVLPKLPCNATQKQTAKSLSSRFKGDVKIQSVPSFRAYYVCIYSHVFVCAYIRKHTHTNTHMHIDLFLDG